MGRIKNSVPALGRAPVDIPYDEWDITVKVCRACNTEKPIEEFQRMVSKRNDRGILNSWCKPCKTLANSNYNKSKVVVRNSPSPIKCHCGKPCRPINHYNDWMEMECSHGHLWYHPREFDFSKQRGNLVLLNS